MWIRATSRWLLGVGAFLTFAMVPAYSEEMTGAAGSPSATTTIPGNQLPPPPQKFEGKIERNAAQSTPWWPARVVPPKGAPNILLIMTDDTRLRRHQHVRWRDPDADPRSDRRQRLAIHKL